MSFRPSSLLLPSSFLINSIQYDIYFLLLAGVSPYCTTYVAGEEPAKDIPPHIEKARVLLFSFFRVFPSLLAPPLLACSYCTSTKQRFSFILIFFISFCWFIFPCAIVAFGVSPSSSQTNKQTTIPYNTYEPTGSTSVPFRFPTTQQHREKKHHRNPARHAPTHPPTHHLLLTLANYLFHILYIQRKS